MKEVEAEIWCPRCKHFVGKVYRMAVSNGWAHVPEPDPIPKYCSVCEQPTERK